MLEALICERYGWTHQEYESQPAYLLDTILEMIKAEGEENSKKK